MIAFLLGVPGKLKSLTDRLTAARGANLDFLDAAILSRAPASSAVSSADYNSARAALLDGIIQNSILKSNIQTGYTGMGAGVTGGDSNYYTDVTVAAVVVAKTLVIIQPVEKNTSDGISGAMVNTTTLRLSSKTNFNQCRWYIIEFK